MKKKEIENLRNLTISVKVTKSEKLMFEAMSEKRGHSVSDWFRMGAKELDLIKSQQERSVYVQGNAGM